MIVKDILDLIEKYPSFKLTVCMTEKINPRESNFFCYELINDDDVLIDTTNETIDIYFDEKNMIQHKLEKKA